MHYLCPLMEPLTGNTEILGFPLFKDCFVCVCLLTAFMLDICILYYDFTKTVRKQCIKVVTLNRPFHVK